MKIEVFFIHPNASKLCNIQTQTFNNNKVSDLLKSALKEGASMVEYTK